MKRTAKSLFLALMCVAMLLALCACGNDNSNDNSNANANTGDNNASAPAADGTVYNLSFTIHDPATSVKTQLYQEKADLVKEETNGAVNITIYSSGTLVAATDVAEGIIAGSADMGWMFTPFFTNQFPLTEVVQAPLQFGDVYATSMTVKQMYEEYPEVQAELANYKVLNVYTQPGNYLFTTKPVHTAADLAGLNNRTSSSVGTAMIGEWGASVMSYGPGDIYEAMEKNAIDGFTFEYSGVKSFNLHEVAKYCTEIPIMTGPFVTAMNLDSWNKLPAEYQAVIEKHFGWNLTEEFARLFEEDLKVGKQLCIDAGVEIIELTDEELATFEVAANAYIDKWCSDYSTGDFDARAFLDHAKEAYEGYLADSHMD